MSLLSFSIGELEGCGRVGDPSKDGTTASPSASIPAGSDSSANDDGSLAPNGSSQSSGIDAGTAAAPVGSVCPAPASADPNAVPSSRPPVWARDVASRSCCYYDDAFLAPEHWARFDSQSECESSCRCADVAPANPDDPSLPPDFQAELRKLTRESISLECFCGAGFTCYGTLEQAKAALCGNDGGPILDGIGQRSGCGLVELVVPFGYGSESWVFDATTGALVGAEVSGDEPSRPCLSVTTRGGRAFSCSDAITECVLCGGSTGVLVSDDACPQ